MMSDFEDKPIQHLFLITETTSSNQLNLKTCLDTLNQWFSKCSLHQNLPKSLPKHQLLAPSPEFNSIGLWKGPKFCISQKIPSDANAAGLRSTYFENHYFKARDTQFLQNFAYEVLKQRSLEKTPRLEDSTILCFNC